MRCLVVMVLLAGCGGSGSPGLDGGSGGGGGGTGGGNAEACVAPGCVLLDPGPSVLQLDVDTQNRPVVLLTTDAQRIRVLRLQGGQWAQVATDFPVPSGNPQLSGTARLALEGDAVVLATVTFGAATNTINVVKEANGAWQPVGVAVPALALRALGLDREGAGARTALVLNVSGNPAQVSTFDAATGAFAAQPGATGPLGGLYGTFDGAVAALTRDFSDEQSLHRLHRWVPATGWAVVGPEVPGTANGTAPVGFASLGNGGAVASFSRFTGTPSFEVFTLASPAGPWVSAGSPTTFSGIVTPGGLAVVGNTPVVALVEKQGVVLGDTQRLTQWKGGAWGPLGDIKGDDTSGSSGPLLAARGATVHVLWTVPGFSPGFKVAYRTLTVP